MSVNFCYLFYITDNNLKLPIRRKVNKKQAIMVIILVACIFSCSLISDLIGSVTINILKRQVFMLFETAPWSNKGHKLFFRVTILLEGCRITKGQMDFRKVNSLSLPSKTQSTPCYVTALSVYCIFSLSHLNTLSNYCGLHGFFNSKISAWKMNTAPIVIYM